jgi:hypothetical protein
MIRGALRKSIRKADKDSFTLGSLDCVRNMNLRTLDQPPIFLEIMG